MRIFFATDLHFISQDLTDNGAAFTNLVTNADGKLMLHVDELLNDFIEDVLREQPDALILGGDMTFNGAVKSHEDLASALQHVKDAGIPVLMIPGNHDLGQYPAAAFHGSSYSGVETLTPQGFKETFRSFGYDDALLRAGDSFSYLYALSDTLYILMLDVNSDWETFSHGERALTTSGEISDETLSFAKEALEKAAADGATVIAVSHQSLTAHNPMFTDGFRMQRHEEVYALYEEMGVKLNLCGHMHMQHITRGSVPEMATSALSVSPLQYGLITVSEKEITYENRLLNTALREEARTFFTENAAAKTAAGLQTSGVSEEDTALLSETFAAINAAYFAGDPLPEDLVNEGTELYRDLKLWEEQKQSFTGLYLRSILGDRIKGEDHHKLVLKR